MKAEKIIEAIESNRNEYNYFGIRRMPASQTVEVGDGMKKSYEWIDGDSTGERLAGTCAIKIDVDAELEEVKRTIAMLDQYGNGQTVLIGSMARDFGSDKNEIVMYQYATAILAD